MKNKTFVITIGLVGVLIIALFLATGTGGNETSPTLTSTSSSWSTTTTSISTTSTSSSSQSLEYTIVNVTKQTPNLLTKLPADPSFISYTLVFTGEKNGTTNNLTEIVNYVSDSIETEIVTDIDTETHVTTFIGNDTMATIIIDGSTTTITNWTPIAIKFFTEYTPFALINGKTMYTYVNGIFATATMVMNANGGFTVNYSRILFEGTNTFSNSVFITGMVSGWKTTESYSLYTEVPSETYVWISGGWSLVPVILFDGSREDTRIFSKGSVNSTLIDSIAFSAVPNVSDYTRSPITVYGDHTDRIVSFSGSIGDIGVGQFTYWITYTGGDFGSITYKIRTAESEFATSTATIPVSSIVQYLNVIKYGSVASISSVIVNGTTALVVYYYDGVFSVPVTFGNNAAQYAFIYKIVTDSNGGSAMVTGIGTIWFGHVAAVTSRR